MEHIKNILPKAIATLEQPTKTNPRNTKAWAKFDEFKTLGDKQLEQMKREAVSFVDDIMCERTPHWLSLLGTSGAGKTMLARNIARLYRNQRHGRINFPASEASRTSARPHGSVIRYKGGFINWGDAINNRMLRGEYEFLDDMREYSFFAIDDIASEYERHRALSSSKLYNVLDARLGKWTVITANLSLDQIGTTLDTRIASRMIRDNSAVVDVDVPDYNVRVCQVAEPVGGELPRFQETPKQPT